MSTTAAAWSARLRWVVVVACVAVALVVASMAALYTALPEIASETGATQSQLTWVVDGYTLALACLVLPAGALGDRFGRRLMLIVGLVVFAASSAVPLMLEGPTWLIVARTAGGVGAALVMPSTLSILTSSLPRQRRSVAIGIWAGTVGVGAVLGILGSGVLMEFWSWTSISVAMAVSGVVLVVAGCTIPESLDVTRPAFDPWGAVTGAVAVGLVVVAALEAPQRGWTDPVVLAAVCAGLVVGEAFVLIELRAEHPLLDVRLFTNRGFGTGTVSVAVQFLVSFGLFMLIVQFFQLILGYGPLMSALALAPMIAPMVVLSVVSPWLAKRYGLRLVTVVGVATLGISQLLLSRLTADSTFVDMLAPLLVMSVGLGLSAAPATTAIVDGAPAGKDGVAAAVNDAAREVGAALGIALSGSILAAGYSERIQAVLPLVPEPARAPVSGSLAGAVEVTERLGPQAKPLLDAAESAFMHGLHNATVLLGGAVLVLAVALGVWAPGRHRGLGTSSESPVAQAESEANATSASAAGAHAVGSTVNEQDRAAVVASR